MDLLSISLLFPLKAASSEASAELSAALDRSLLVAAECSRAALEAELRASAAEEERDELYHR